MLTGLEILSISGLHTLITANTMKVVSESFVDITIVVSRIISASEQLIIWGYLHRAKRRSHIAPRGNLRDELYSIGRIAYLPERLIPIQIYLWSEWGVSRCKCK